MEAIDILRNHICDLEKMVLVFDEYAMYKSRDELKKAIQELTQVIVELENLQNENKSLVKTLEKYDKEMIMLRKQNQDLLNTIIQAQESIKNILESNKWKKWHIQEQK